ncbi:MAG: hypothetical protein PHY12_00325 [Eubacteriales bacterium]|nr:hypothetical protein [Eubacteriales bacterium]
MKRKMSLGFVLAMVLVLLAAVALAWGLSYSPEVSATLAARNAVMEKYGLTQEAMDMLGTRTEETAQGTVVRFVLSGEMSKEEERVGTYTVTVAKDGSAAAEWSHDDVDPAVYADGSLEDEVWGGKQIAAYRAMRDQAAREYQKEWEALYGENGTAVQPTAEPAAIPQGKLTQEEAVQVADRALLQIDGFTDETLALFTVEGTIGEAGFGEHQDDVWAFNYEPGELAWRELDTADGNPLGIYSVAVLDGTGEVLDVKWSLEGVDNGTYTEQTWGQAKAYSASMLPWVAKLLKGCEPLQQKYENVDGTWSVEDKAAHDQLFRDAGFDPLQYDHVLPGKTDITYEQALNLAAQVLQTEYGVSRAVFDASGFAYADLEQREDHREWYFWVQNNEELCTWTVVLNSETSEVLYLGVDPDASANG